MELLETVTVHIADSSAVTDFVKGLRLSKQARVGGYGGVLLPAVTCVFSFVFGFRSSRKRELYSGTADFWKVCRNKKCSQ